jgi:hypothetical protein
MSRNKSVYCVSCEWCGMMGTDEECIFFLQVSQGTVTRVEEKSCTRLLAKENEFHQEKKWRNIQEDLTLSKGNLL